MKEGRKDDHHKAHAAHEVIVTVCCYCARVKSPLGEWDATEGTEVVSLQAAISHGICPRCMDEHYPE